MKNTFFARMHCRYSSILIILITGLIINSISLLSQGYMVRNYTEENGLACSEVYDLTQDFSGRLWFATRTGVSVYDGSTWKTFSNSSNLPADVYSMIECGPEGRVWVLSNFATLTIAFYKTGSERWVLLPAPRHARDREQVISFALAKKKDKTVAAVATKRLGLFLWKDNNWTNIKPPKEINDAEITSIITYKDCFYIASEKGLFVLDGDNISGVFEDSGVLPAPGIAALAVEDSNLWLLGRNWLGYMKNNALQVVSRDIDVNFDWNGIFLQPDGYGGVLYGSRHVIFRFDRSSGTVERFGGEQRDIIGGATNMYLDREKNLWFTSMRGVAKISSMRFVNYRNASGLLDDETTAICEFAPGRLLLGHNEGFTFFNLKEGSFEPKPFVHGEGDQSIGTRVLDLRKDREGNTWLAASSLGAGKITRENPDAICWYNNLEGSPSALNSILPDKSGRVWAAANDGLYMLQGAKFIKKEPDEGSPSISVRKLFPGPGDSIYLATMSKGIYLLKDNKLKPFLKSKARAANSIYAVFIDNRQTMWVGTKAGLYVAGKEALIKFEKKGFHLDRPVYFILQDHRDRLWFGTDNGVTRWNGEEPKLYTVRQGLLGRETNRAAGFVDPQGRVWIGTDRGLNCYREEFEKKDIPPPLVELLFLDVAGQRLPMQVVNKLKHRMNNIIFNFRAVSFIDEDGVRFQSKLEGFDGDWSEPGRFDNIRYTNLKPGRYRFHLKARNSEGLWSEVVSSAEIIILRPAWKRWWFSLFVLIVLGFVIFILNKYVTRKRYASILENQVREKTAELQKAHDELETRVKERTMELTGAIEALRESEERVKTSLLEKEILLKEIHHRVKNNLQVIVGLLNLQSKYIEDKQAISVFKNSRQRVMAMALVHEKLYQSEDLSRINFREYIHSLVQHLFDTYSYMTDMARVQFKTEIDDVDLDVETAMPLGLLINELVTNAFKYAFPGGREGKLRIALDVSKREGQKDEFRLIVEDDGVGFPKDREFPGRGSLGTLLVNSLVQQLGGVIDLDRGGGTKFTIKFKRK